MVSLKRKLFQIKFDNEIKPLFESQTKLVNSIYEDKVKDGTYSENEIEENVKAQKASIQIILSKCINGKRGLTESLKKRINNVLLKRLKDNVESKYIIEEIFRSFDFIHDSTKVNESANKMSPSIVSPFPKGHVNKKKPHQAIFDEFINRSELADTVLRTTPAPGEITGTINGNKMIEFISDSIGLYDQMFKARKLEYFFPMIDNMNKIAIEFWRNIYAYNEKLGIPNLKEKIIEANLNRQIIVYSIDDEITHFPVTCFDFGDYHETLYSTNLVADSSIEVLSVMPLNSTISSLWKSKVKNVLLNKDRYEITFLEAYEVFNKKSSIKKAYQQMELI